MKKVQIIGPRVDLDEAIKVLHALAVVHIETLPEEPSAGGPEFRRLPLEKEKLEEKAMLDAARKTLTSLLALLNEPRSYYRVPVSASEIPALIEELRPVLEEAKALHITEDELSEELNLVDKYEKVLKKFAPIVSRLGGLRNFEIDGLTLEKTREDVTEIIRQEVDRITGGSYEMHVTYIDDDTIGVVLTYPKKFAPEVRYLTSGRSISEIKLPGRYEEMTLLSALTTMGRRKEELPGLIEQVEADLERLSERWYGTAASLLKVVEDAREEIGALAFAGQTRFTFVIQGWVPADMLERLKAKFHAIFGAGMIIRELDIREDEEDLVPVCIRNPRIFRPFELFLSALTPPRYGSVDPTPYVALFFPTFFGLIVGDVAYGAIIVAAALALKPRFRGREFYSDLLSVFVICGLSAMLFGFLFGELFGDLGVRLGIMQPILLHRLEALKTLMIITIGIGVGHVALGLALGAVNRMYRGKRREAGIKLTYLALIAAFLFVLAVLFEFLPRGLMTPGVLALVAGLAILVLLEGAIAPLEFVKTLGNILSYLRIMAVGTASVVMALVANRMGELSDNIIVGVIIAGVIHLFNIFLSVMSPSIQSMRLQYVEFFSKFYEGGGRKYEPFKKR